MIKYILFLLGLILVSCSSSELYVKGNNGAESSKIPSEDELLYQVFLLGDMGTPSLDVQEPTLKLFQKQAEQAGERSAAIFLGDNIYSSGLPDSSHPNRSFYEKRLLEQLRTVENYKGRVVFIPGNHDWDNGGIGGLEAVKRQEQFVEAYLKRGNTFLPDNGFPGPVSVRLMDDDEDPRLREDIRLIVLDTQWWLHRYEKPFGDTGEYELRDAGDILIELEDILKKQRKDHLLVVGHHPFRTNDNHGGYLPPSIHLKPPVFGSLYALYRRVFGLRQDIHHHEYAEMIRSIEHVFNAQELEDLIYAAGHSHSLQYHKKEGKRITHHYLVSGAGTKVSYVAPGRGAEFTYQENGYMVLKYYADSSIWMEAWGPEGDGSSGKMIYRTLLKDPFEEAFPEQAVEEVVEVRDFSDSTKIASANEKYDGKNRLFEFLLGDHNRKYWSVEDEFPVFDVSIMEGGLTPVRTAGRGQSTTIHLEREDGRDFVLRSVDKEAGRVWDENLRQTFALDLAQDQFSVLNPYGALVAPTLADAIGTYHTNPRIFYIPDDPDLGLYGDLLSGQLALFEERPNGEMRDVASVGFSEEVLSSTELIRELDNDIDHRVDQKAFARNRLLDMLLADWDRHGDQWRWASFEPEDEKGKLYQPIPRDRDLALAKMTGIIPYLGKIFGPFYHYQNFEEDYGNLKALNGNSLSLSRRLTNQLGKSEWIDIAEEMQEVLTDEVIEEAVSNFPDSVFAKYGVETIRVFKIRRDKIVDVAESYYDLLAEVVSVQGSNKRELFEVEVLSDQAINLNIYKLAGNGEVREKYFDRTFLRDETNEIRLYGKGGNDEFRLFGEAENSTIIRIVGGSGEDLYTDETQRKGLSRRVNIYDTEQGNEVNTGRNAKVRLTDIPENLHQNHTKDYQWNSVSPGLYFEYSGNDGFFIGGGPKFVRHGFRKIPASTHFARANYAPSTGAANVRYTGTWYKAPKNWDTNLDAEFLFPESYKNFFGFGNETTLEDRSLNYYRARLYQYTVSGGFNHTKNIMQLYAGLKFQGTNIERDPDNIISDPVLGIPDQDLDELWFAGFTSSLSFSDLDDALNPKQGFDVFVEAELNTGLLNTSEVFTRIHSELEWYVSPRLDPQITMANRIGSAHIIGNFPFYEATTLGMSNNLRGYNSRRFSGRTAVFNNAEVRMELFDFYNYLLGGKVGLSAFFDVGRVWINDEESTTWHSGYGGGIWFNIFESFLVNSSIGLSKEGTLFTLKAGFLF